MELWVIEAVPITSPSTTPSTHRPMATELKNAQTIELYLLDGRLNLGNRLAWYYSSVAKLLYMISCNETAFISILEKTPIT